jgi:hypothetical protein
VPDPNQYDTQTVLVRIYLCDTETALLQPFYEGRPRNEPYTNSARESVVLSAEVVPSSLKDHGYFNVGHMTVREDVDAPLLNSRCYQYKIYCVAGQELTNPDNLKTKAINKFVLITCVRCLW